MEASPRWSFAAFGSLARDVRQYIFGRLFRRLQQRAELVELLLRPFEVRIPALLALVLCGVDDHCCAWLRLRVRWRRVGLPRRSLGDARGRAESYGGCNRISCKYATQNSFSF